MSSTTRFIGTAALALGALLTSPPAGAEPQGSDASDSNAARIAELNEAGAKAYAERNYRAAIEKFVEAYAIDHDPNLLFNIARCYEKLGDLPAAIEKYETFIATPGADTEGRLKAKASLRELRQLESQGGTTQESSAAPEASESPRAADTDAQSSSTFPRLLPWLSLGGGAVLAGVGATFYVFGMRDHDQVTSAKGYGSTSSVHPMTRSEAQSYVDAGDTKKRIGGIGLGLGGALLATSAVLFLTGGNSAEPETTTRLSLEPSPTGVVATYGGRF